MVRDVPDPIEPDDNDNGNAAGNAGDVAFSAARVAAQEEWITDHIGVYEKVLNELARQVWRCCRVSIAGKKEGEG